MCECTGDEDDRSSSDSSPVDRDPSSSGSPAHYTCDCSCFCLMTRYREGKRRYGLASCQKDTDAAGDARPCLMVQSGALTWHWVPTRELTRAMDEGGSLSHLSLFSRLAGITGSVLCTMSHVGDDGLCPDHSNTGCFELLFFSNQVLNLFDLIHAVDPQGLLRSASYTGWVLEDIPPHVVGYWIDIRRHSGFCLPHNADYLDQCELECGIDFINEYGYSEFVDNQDSFQLGNRLPLQA